MGRRGTAAAGIALAVLALAVGLAAAAIGDLDQTFSGDGKLVLNVDNGSADDVAVDSQNRVLIAFDLSVPGPDVSDFAVARFLSNGNLDASYGGGDGVANVDAGGGVGSDQPQAIVLDLQGRAVIGGFAGTGPDRNTAIVRLTATGSADPSFGGGDGLFQQNLDAGDDDFVNDLAIDASGRIVGAGQIGPNATPNALALRLTDAGALDPGFAGPDGFDSLNVNSVGSEDRAFGVDVDSAGRVLIAGTTEIAAGQGNFFAARYLDNGSLDTPFTSNPVSLPGRSITDASAGVAPDEDDGAGAVKVDSSDRPVLGGFAERTGSGSDLAVLRLTAGGLRDTSFSGDGAAFVDYGGNEFGQELAIDGAGRPVIVGFGDTGPAEFAVARFLTSGDPDLSFSGDGKVNTDVGPSFDSAHGVTIDRGGRPVVAGAASQGMGSDPAVARYEGVPRCAGKVPTLTGTPGKDKLKGTKRKDVISGGAGKDTISGLGKADTICGEAGKDRLLGGKGNDRLLGGKGNDTLIGGPGGKDRLKGGKGKDVQRQ